jgi:hypothetical protein
MKTRIVIDDITASKMGQSRMSSIHNIFHITVTGTISPYQTVDIVTKPHQSDCGMEEKIGFIGNST